MYVITVDRHHKLLLVKGMGMYQEEELRTFINDYRTKVTTISQDYTLVLDTKDLKTSQQDRLATMKDIMNMYFETKFKARYYIQPDSKIAAMQMRRITEIQAYSKLKVIESLEKLKKALVDF